jgi:hypothetical protein
MPIRTSTRRTNGFMTSRAAILTALVLGLLLSSTGTSLAISGFADNDQAAIAQYPYDHADGANDQVLAAYAQEDGPAGQEAAQPVRQLTAGVQESGGGQLPFSGFAAIPVLAIGLGLAGAGVVLRRSGRSG